MQKKEIKKEKVYDSDNDSVISSSESDRSTSPQQKSKKQKIVSNISSPNLNLPNKQSAENNTVIFTKIRVISFLSNNKIIYNLQSYVAYCLLQFVQKNQQGSLNSSLMQSRSNILSQMTPQQQSLNQIRSIIQSFYVKQQLPQQQNSQINQHQSDLQQSQIKMSLLEQQNRQYQQKIKTIEQAKNSDSKVIKNSIAQIQSQLFDIRHKVESMNSKSKEKNQKKTKQNEKNSDEHNKIKQKEKKIKKKSDQEKDTSVSSLTSSEGDEKSLVESLSEDEDSMIEYSSNKHNSKNKSKKKNKNSGITENIKGYLILNAHKLQHEGKKNQLLKEILNKKIPDQTTLSNHLVMERYDIVLRDILDVFLEYLLRSEPLHVNTAYILQTEKNNLLKKSIQTNQIKQINASPQKQQFDVLKKHEINLSQKNNQNATNFVSSEHNPLYSQNRLITNESNSGGQMPYSNNTIQPFTHSISKSNSLNPTIQQISQNNIDQISYRKSLNNDSRMQQLLSPPLNYSNQQSYPVVNIDCISNLNDHQTILNQGIIGSNGRNPSSTKSASSKQISFHNQVSSQNQNLHLNSGNSRGSIDWYQQQMKTNKKFPQQISMTQQSSSRLNREGSQGILKQNNVSYFINTEDQGFESKGSASTKMSENARKNQRLNHAISESQINLLKQNQIQKQFLQQQQYQQGINQIPQILQNNQIQDNFGIIHSFSNFQNSLSPKNNQDLQSARNANNLKINQVESLMSSQFQNSNQELNNAPLYGNQQGIISQIGGGNTSNLSQNHQSLFSSPNKQAQLFQFQHKYSSSLPFESFMNLNASTSKNNDSLEHNHSRFLQSTSNPSRDYYSPDFKQRMMVNGFSKEILNIYPEQLFFQNDTNNLHERYQNQQIQLNNQVLRNDQDFQSQEDYNNHQISQQESQDFNKLTKSASIQKNMQMNSSDQIVSEENYQEDTTSIQEQSQNSRQKIAHSKSLNLLMNKSKIPSFSPENTPTSLKSPSIIKKNPQLKLMPCHKHNKSATIVVKRKNSDNSDHSNSISNMTNNNNNIKQQQSNQQKCSNCLIINNREEVKQRFQKLPPSIEQVGRKGKNSSHNNNIKEIFNYNLEKQQSTSQK
ncbi:poly polymerase central domain protein (macronuclear) [Tetrahymena thermophila SB210]|uniref:Poly polymerase central domain protein n=1 Tax=Tetrahymena thermophila (strain SB210) TaxID=312017 RepID=I7LWD5_TETTS|nr:poly polymerase central domain protein [Tetrahymena thermophila SB210]EAS01427.3 poly polymerase central domain protein [Tetrahymena thermophila SB210]|eukprot:XP_001021673.3 poly polymerase central domain protein [Tetrahymena thermophila SB210]